MTQRTPRISHHFIWFLLSRLNFLSWVFPLWAGETAPAYKVLGRQAMGPGFERSSAHEKDWTWCWVPTTQARLTEREVVDFWSSLVQTTWHNQGVSSLVRNYLKKQPWRKIKERHATLTAAPPRMYAHVHTTLLPETTQQYDNDSHVGLTRASFLLSPEANVTGSF